MASLDRISPLLERLRVRTRLFNAGRVCGVTTYAARPGRGFLHVLRDGQMTVTHRRDGHAESISLDQPSLVLYPRPLEHAFRTDPSGCADLVCASLDFDGGEHHPLVRTLPAMVVVPLDSVDALGPALDLLFAEIDHVRCGHHVMADRLLEVVLIHLYRWMLDHPEDLDLPPGLFVGLSDDRLARALVALHAAPEQDWTLSSLAREASMSRSSFAERFKTLVGQTPLEYLTRWRITIAQQRLRTGDSVARTATSLGYSSPAAFTRAFTQRVGRSPRAWLADDRDVTAAWEPIDRSEP